MAPKGGKPELRVLSPARRLIVLYTCVKYHENITVFKLQSKHEIVKNRRTDRCGKTRGKTICFQVAWGGGGLT